MNGTPLSDQAITAALNQNWKEAIRVNKIILEEDKNNIDALLRLAYAYTRQCQITLAKRTYESVLSIDKYNQIAKKNIKKLVILKKRNVVQKETHAMSPLIFLEEPGKTKIVECIHIAPANVLSTLSAGQEVILKTRNHCVEIRSCLQTYLAALPDDMSFKLNTLTAGGNTYQAVIKSVAKNSLKILIREISRGKRFAKQPSFISSTSYIPFSKTTSSSDTPDMTPTGESTDHEHSDGNQETQC
jgi:tetratricopeptide (TPR) repeat protein